MKRKILITMMAVALTLVLGGIGQADVMLSGANLTVGVSNSGALCSLTLPSIAASPTPGPPTSPTPAGTGLGIVYTGPGATLPNDWTLPGIPWEYWSIGVGGTYATYGVASYPPPYVDMNPGGYVTANHSSATQQYAQTNGPTFTVGTASIAIGQSVAFFNNGSTIYVGVDIKNMGAAPITGLVYARGMDPDPDEFTYGTYQTNNFLTPGGVEAVGPISGMYCKLLNNSSLPYVAAISGPAAGPWTTNPYTILAAPATGLINGAVAGNPLDYSINMAWEFPTLGVGQSYELDFIYELGVPLPASVLLLGSGLLGLLGLRKFRRH